MKTNFICLSANNHHESTSHQSLTRLPFQKRFRDLRIFRKEFIKSSFMGNEKQLFAKPARRFQNDGCHSHKRKRTFIDFFNIAPRILHVFEVIGDENGFTIHFDSLESHERKDK